MNLSNGKNLKKTCLNEFIILYLWPIKIKMAEKFPFSLNDAEHIICSTDYMVPGMNRVVFVYYSHKYGMIKAIEAMPPYLDPKGFKEYLLKEKDIEHIKQLREEKNTYRWYSEAELFLLPIK